MNDTTASTSTKPRRRLLRWVGAAFLVLVLAVGGWLVYLQSQLADVPRFDMDLDRQGRPPAVDSDSLNILLAGVDLNEGADEGADLREMLEDGDWEPGAYRSDAILVLHLEEGGTGGQLVSIPRDSYVPVAGFGSTKINAAMSQGGPELLARTVEDLTGVRLDHVAVVDFEGFRGLTELIGGVEVTIPETVHDSKTDKTWTAGTHTIEGEDALLYVRQRHGLPGGDFDRVQRQQNFLRAFLERATSRGVLANPVTLTGFVRDLSELLAVDDALTSGRMRALALGHRSLSSDELRFLTVPHHGSAMIDGASVVRLDEQAVRDMFAAIAEDRFDRWAVENSVDELPTDGEVR